MDYKQFNNLVETSPREFADLLAGERVRELVKAACPDLLHSLASRLHQFAGEQGEPVSNYDIEVVKMIDID